MDENPFASGDDDDDEDNNNNNNNNLMPPPTRNDSINNNKKEQFNNNNGMEQNTARASNSNNSSMLITKKTSLWGDNDDDDDDDTNTNTNTNTNNSKVKKNKKEDEDGQKNNNDSNFFGDEDVVDITAQNVVVASSFLSAKNDPLSQMASYHEQTSYSFHGSIMQDDNLASPLAAFETFIPGSKSALSKREEEEIASMSARKKEGSDSMKEVELQDRSGDKNEAKVVDEIVEIQLDEEDEEEQKQNRRYYKAAESERFNSPFNKSVSATATTTTTAPTLASSSSDFEPPPPSYADSVMYANPAIQPGNSMMMMMNSTAPAMMRAETFDSSMQQQPLLLPEQQQQQQSIYTQLQQRQQQQQMSGSLSPQFQFYPPYDPSKDETLVNPGDEKKTELIAYISEAKTESEFNQQGGAGLSKKVTRYKINFKTNSEKFMQKEAIVWRRFSDFVQLHDRLLESHRGYFIPPRPEKSIKRLGDEAFVQSRKLMLQNYLEKLIKHPSLRSSLALKVFLTQQDLHQSREWHALATPSTTSIPPSSLPPGYQQHEQVQQSSPSMQFAPDSHMMASSPIGGINPTSPMGAAASNGGSAIFTQQNVSASMMMTSPTPVSSHATAAPAVSPNSRSSVGKFFRELRQSMATSSAVVAVGGAFGIESAKPKIVEEDAQFLVDKEKSTKLETELCGLSLKTEKILQREEKFADSLGAFGLECMKFARVEEEASGISGRYSEPGTRLATAAQIFRKVGNASVRASRIARAATVQLAKAMDPLHAHLNLMPSVRRATQLRAETLLSLQTLLSDQERLTIRISKLAPDITKHAKIEQLKRELEETNRLAENARREYDCIRARQSNEFARSEKERVEDFSSMLLGLARVQVAQAERTLSVWRNLAEELGASPEEWSETLNSPTPPEKVDGEDLQR